MAIRVNLDMMLVRRKMSLTERSERVGVTIANLSVLKTGRARAVRAQAFGAVARGNTGIRLSLGCG